MATSKRKKNSVIVQSQRFGQVVADVYRRTAFYAGHTFLDFTLTRAWQPRPDGRENFSDRFYDRNHEDLHKAIDWAANWIRKHPEAADESWNAKTNGAADVGHQRTLHEAADACAQ